MQRLLDKSDASATSLRIAAITGGRFRARVYPLIAVLAVLFGLGTLLLGILHVLKQSSKLQEAKSNARAIALDGAVKINSRLQSLTPVAERIAADLTSGALQPQDVPARLKQALQDYPDLFEAGFAYQPYAKDKNVKLFAPHVVRKGNGIEEFQLEDRYDYTTRSWFQDGIAAGAPHWSDPYLGLATKTLVVGYSVPFFRKGDPSGQPMGLVRINLSLDQIHAIVSGVGMGETGHAFLLSNRGVFLSHPVEDYMREQRNIFDVAREHNDESGKRQGQLAMSGKAGEDEGVSWITGQQICVFMQPVPITGWSFGLVFMKDEMLLEPQALRRSLTHILCCAVMFLLMLSVLWFWVDRATDRSLWRMVIATSVIAVLGVSVTWRMTLRYPDRNGEIGVHVYDNSGLQRFLGANAKLAGNGAPRQIKTGIFVRTMRFGTANDVNVTGTIWQKFDGPLKDFTPGVTFPNAETLETKDSYHTQEGGSEVIGWDFKATLRVPFEGSFKYPFDRGMVRVRIAPKGLYKDIVLVPDLGAYQLMVPSTLPGTDKSLVLPGWKLISTYFIYTPVSTGTNFGIGTALEQAKGQELGFTMIAQRNFLDPFVSNVLPIIVVASLLFGMLIAGSKQTAKIAATGFKATDVLRASVSLLFPVLLAQVNMRNRNPSSNIIYIEYFYFVLYTAILGVSANALLFTLKGHGFSNYRDNIIPKLVFWPYLLGAFFIITLAFLY